MPKTHPHAEATYRVVERNDKTYGVEVTVPDTFPTIISPFASEAEAETWIENHKKQVVEGDPGMRSHRRTWSKGG